MHLAKGIGRLTMGYMVPLSLLGIWRGMEYFEDPNKKKNAVQLLNPYIASQIKGWSTITLVSIMTYSALSRILSGWTFTGFIFSMAWNGQSFLNQFGLLWGDNDSISVSTIDEIVE